MSVFGGEPVKHLVSTSVPSLTNGDLITPSVETVSAGTRVYLAGVGVGTLATPIRNDPTGTTDQPVRLKDGTGNAITSTGGKLDVNVALDSVTVAGSAETSTVYNGVTALTPKFATISASSSGNNTLVAAVTSKKIRVLAYNFIANGTVNAKFQSGASGTDLTGLKYCVVNSGICAPFNPVGWFETAAATLLNINLSGAVAIGGELVYVEV